MNTTAYTMLVMSLMGMTGVSLIILITCLRHLVFGYGFRPFAFVGFCASIAMFVCSLTSVKTVMAIGPELVESSAQRYFTSNR